MTWKSHVRQLPDTRLLRALGEQGHCMCDACCFPWRHYIDRRLDDGDTAQSIARDLWFWLSRTLNDARFRTDDDAAARLTRQLAYLCAHYDVRSADDPYQGWQRYARRPAPTTS